MAAPSNPYLPSLESLADQIKEHWRVHNPRLYSEAVQKRQLDQLAKRRAEDTLAHAQALEKQGCSPLEASSEAMREIALQIIR